MRADCVERLAVRGSERTMRSIDEAQRNLEAQSARMTKVSEK